MFFVLSAILPACKHNWLGLETIVYTGGDVGLGGGGNVEI